MAAAGTIGLPAVRAFSPRASHARGVPAYSPAARFDLAVSEVEFRRNSAGRMLMARIYQPKGPGPFPTLLDLHGGAWNRKRPFRRRANGSRAGCERPFGRRRGPDARARSALSGLRAGRQLRGALAQGECGNLER